MPVPEPVPVPEMAPSPPPPAAPRPHYRIARTTGAAEDYPGPLGHYFTTPESSELAIDLPNGARLTLEPNSRAVLLGVPRATIVLLDGALHAQLLPQGAAPGRAPLRIVSAQAVLAIAVAGELWLDGRSVSVLAGSVERERASELSTPFQLETLAAGQLLRAGAPAPVPGPRSVEQARAESRKRGQQRVAEAPRETAADAEGALSRALGAWDAAERRATELLSVQRAAKERGDSAAAQASQRDLVSLAQSKLDLRKRVRLAFELAAARQLASSDAAEIAAFASRMEARAAEAIPSGL